MGLLMAISQEFPEAVHDLLQLTRSAKNGITVEISPLVFKHSREQENYYRKWCREFANFIGMTPHTMHDEMLCIYFGYETVTTPWGWRRNPFIRSGKLTIEQYGELIETLIRTAAEQGFVVPPPVRKTGN